jgi:lysozyme family protein
MIGLFDQAFDAIAATGDRAYAPAGETMVDVLVRARPDIDPNAASPEAIRPLCRREYWTAVRGDLLPPPVGLVALDAAIYHGPRRAVEWLQVAVSAPMIGVISKATIDAAARIEATDVCAEMICRRMVFLTQHPGWRVSGVYWARRIAHLSFIAGAWSAK